MRQSGGLAFNGVPFKVGASIGFPTLCRDPCVPTLSSLVLPLPVSTTVHFISDTFAVSIFSILLRHRCSLFSVVAASAKNAAAAVMIAVKEDPLGADLSLALLGMAVSSYR